MYMEDWIFISVFHNLSILERIESKYVVIVPKDDLLTQTIRDRSLAFSQFVDNFKDQFGREFAPCLLFLHRRVKPDVEAIISFRNLLAISSIVQSWERFICYGTQLDYFKFSNYFELYPYSLSRDEKDLIVNTPSVMGVDEPSEFQGQCSPEIARSDSTRKFYDFTLFEALCHHWVEYYVKRKRNEWKNRSLFRSLEMAFRASGLPFRNQGTIHDYGANIALWISAFEILNHPGGRGGVSLSTVLNFLGEIVFKTKKLNHKHYNGRRTERLNLLQKTYLEMYKARNHFLHGNPVRPSSLFPGGVKKCNPLIAVAPVIYKCSIYHFLGLLEFDKNNTSEIVQDLIRRRDLETAISKFRDVRRNYKRKSKKP